MATLGPQGVARLADQCVPPPGIAVTCSASVFANVRGVNRVGDVWIAPPMAGTLATGSSVVYSNSRPQGRKYLDITTFGALVITGSETVFAG